MTISKEGNTTTFKEGNTTAYQRYSLDKSSSMITQQRLPVHLEYLQTHITTTESKASPLALLAATCSSIGKTDNDESSVKTTSTVLHKLSTHEEDTKSSFKPYKLEVTPTLVRSSTSSLTSSDHSGNLSSTSSVPSTRVAPDLEREKRCYSADAATSEYPAPLKCHTTSPPLSHLGSKVPYVHAHAHSHRDHVECVQCNTMRPHSDPLPIVNRSQVATSTLCQCPMCHQARDNMKCHYQGVSSMTPLYPPSYKAPSFTPLITCRDPNCSNCSKFSHSNFQNFLHPALIHQCTHNTAASYKPPSYPVPPPPSHVAPYDSYLKSSPTTKPYVCNWVSEGKHCGNTFVTSEELFQHLRTHTNSQQASHCDKTHEASTVVVGGPSLLPQSASVPTTCNIHGCPCQASQRKSSPKQPAHPHAPYGGLELTRRYSPYSRMLQNGANSISGHSYPPHSLYHY